VARPRSKDKRWDSKFAQFIDNIGPGNLAKLVDVKKASVYHWLSGKNSPRRSIAFSIQKIAKRRGVSLSQDEIYQHYRDLQSARHKVFQRSSQHARLL
jgi:hypothetical protein